jgi:rod shape-determining protein MreC
MTKRRKRIIIFFTLCVVGLTLFTIQHNRKPLTALKGIAYPFDMLNNATKSLMGNVRDLLDTYEENKQLRQELSKLVLETQRLSEIIYENKRLRELLSLKEGTVTYVTAAKVIGHGYDKFLETLILDKGEKNGIKVDMAVVTTKGLAGKIVSASPDFSKMILVRDPNFSVAVRLQKSRVEGIFSGTGEPYGLIKYVSFETPVEQGEVVITSGLDGIFPQGIPVGTVLSFSRDGALFFQNIKAMPYQSGLELEEVVILRSAVSKPSTKQAF